MFSTLILSDTNRRDVVGEYKQQIFLCFKLRITFPQKVSLIKTPKNENGEISPPHKGPTAYRGIRTKMCLSNIWLCREV